MRRHIARKRCGVIRYDRHMKQPKHTSAAAASRRTPDTTMAAISHAVIELPSSSSGQQKGSITVMMRIALFRASDTKMSGGRGIRPNDELSAGKTATPAGAQNRALPAGSGDSTLSSSFDESAAHCAGLP